MENVFIKQINPNSKNKDFIYYKLNNKGEILAVSTANKTISKPKVLSLFQKFEFISSEEFEKELKTII
jgi:hypothetical protein